MKRSVVQQHWREVLIDGYAVMGCVTVFVYLIWRLVA